MLMTTDASDKEGQARVMAFLSVFLGAIASEHGSTRGISSGLADVPEERQGRLPDASDILVPGLVSEKEA